MKPSIGSCFDFDRGIRSEFLFERGCFRIQNGIAATSAQRMHPQKTPLRLISDREDEKIRVKVLTNNSSRQISQNSAAYSISEHRTNRDKYIAIGIHGKFYFVFCSRVIILEAN